MKLAIMQPYFFPYIGYWQIMNSVDKYVIYDDVNYIKGGWINRNFILINGEKVRINLNLHHASPFKKINETEMLHDNQHRYRLLKVIENAYKKAPHFVEAFAVIEEIILQDEYNLAKYLAFSFEQICKYLSINTELIISSTLKKDNDERGFDKVISICKLLEATVYRNSMGGVNLYTKERFEDYGIQLEFIQPNTVSYKQFNDKFIPDLSIIDVMMFNSKDDIKEMLGNYTLR